MLWLEPKVYIKVKDDSYKLMLENPLDKTKNINGSSRVLNSTYYKQGPMHHVSIHVHVEEWIINVDLQNPCASNWMKMVNSVHILIIFPFKHSYEKGICVGKGDLCWDWTLGWCPKFDTFFLKMLWFRSWSNKKDVIHIHLWLCNPFHYYVLFNVVITFVHDV